MGENAFVCWTTSPEPWLIEREAIRTVCLPLNIQHNRQHPFCATLTACRREAKRRADLLSQFDWCVGGWSKVLRPSKPIGYRDHHQHDELGRRAALRVA
jgi:hypothetical protein